MSDLAFYSILWWTATLLSGSIAYRYFYQKHGHGLRAEFRTLAVMVAVIAFGAWTTNVIAFT